MIRHMLAKLYGTVMEVELNDYMETISLRWAEEFALDDLSLLLTIMSKSLGAYDDRFGPSMLYMSKSLGVYDVRVAYSIASLAPYM